jgi:uncharacterized glyoxalase superfamily protein PhnB
MPPGTVQGLVLATDDVDGALRELSERGVVFRDPLTDSPWGRWTSFADPDGNGWVLQQNRAR